MCCNLYVRFFFIRSIFYQYNNYDLRVSQCIVLIKFRKVSYDAHNTCNHKNVLCYLFEYLQYVFFQC